MAAMEDQPSLRGRDIVCIGFADWDTELWTNQHHLMSRLAHDNHVLFVESLGLRQPQLARRDLTRIIRRLRRGLSPPRTLDGVHVLSPLILPLHRYRIVRALNRLLLSLRVRHAARQLGFSDPVLWGYVPQAEILEGVLKPSLTIYHCVDDIAAQERIDTKSFREAEERYAGRASLVLASSPALAIRMRELSSNVLEVQNVADTGLFATALKDGPIDPTIADLPKPRIVFTGAIVSIKLDFALLVALARERPNFSFVLVGPVGPGDPHTDVSALEVEPNIHLLGSRTYTELPDVLRAADVGLIPYLHSRLTESIFPMKVYEYMAAGLPVIATPLPALSGVQWVTTAENASGMARLIDKALAGDGPERRAERSRAAREHSWERRLQEIATALQAL
ncbi:MAG: glycosyltransferase [Solirubrobacteraceae bacterium]